MKLFRAALLAAYAAGASLAVHAQGLCKPAETSYFNCATGKGRAIALCGTRQTGLQYRFGPPGRVELAYPTDPKDGATSFWYAHYVRAQTDRIEIRFANAGVEYILFDYTEDGRTDAGVRAMYDGKESAVACRGQVRSRLIELREKLMCDADNALTMGSCP